MDYFGQDEKMTSLSKREIIQRLLGYMLKYKKDIVIVLLLMTVTIAVAMLNPILIKIVIDDYIEKKQVGGLLVFTLIGVFLNLLSMIVMRKRIIIMGEVSNKALMDIRQELYEHIQNLGFDFFDNRPTGKILARVIGDVNSLKAVLHQGVVTLIPEFMTLIVVLVIMVTLNYRLALAGIALLPMMLLGIYFVEIRAHKRWQVFRKKNSNMNAFTHEDFSGIAVVQSFTAEEQTSRTFASLLKEVKDSFYHAVKLNNLFWPMAELSWGLGTILVFVAGLGMIREQTITVGLLVAFINYIAMFWRPMMNLSNFYNQLVSNMAGAERIFEIMDIEPVISDSQQAVTLPPVAGRIEFEQVDFAYNQKKKVLEKVSFVIEPGEKIALVGPTGGGKTTIASLIARFYEINSGRILVDGYDIRQVTLDSLRSQMGVMTQETVLFSGTIADNIRYGKLDADQEAIEAAAKAVHVHDYIMSLEKGYQTKINEKGSRFSAGQQQLIAFARTMISQPKILVLDEATSSIDTHTERLIQQGIDSLLKGRTSLVIAHRLSTIQNADRIFVVGDYGIIESGSHQQLLDAKGHYYQLYQAQREEVIAG